MIYILSGNDEVYKNEIIDNIKNTLVDYDYQFYYIESEGEFNQILEKSTLFLNTISFFDKPKLLKLSFKNDTQILKILKSVVPLCNDKDVVIININSLKQTILKKIHFDDNLIYLNSSNFKNKNDFFKYLSNFFNKHEITFKTYKDKELLTNLLLSNSKVSNLNEFDKQTLKTDLDSLLSSYKYCSNPIEFEEIKKIYTRKFDGNFFTLADSIFNQNSILDIINTLETDIELMNLEDIYSFLRIIIYMLKEYLKYNNNNKTKKYYLFKNSKIKLLSPELFLLEIDELSFNTRLSKKFDKEAFIIIIIKHVKYI